MCKLPINELANKILKPKGKSSMKVFFNFLIVSLISFAATAHENGPGVTNAKAAELSAHRIDRLVTLGKIDQSFLYKFDKLEITVANQPPVYYKVTVSQTKPIEGSPLQLEISFDDDGKPISYQVSAGGAAGPDIGWSAKDAVSLAENALHYVLENNSDQKIALFDRALSSFSLTKVQLNGQEVAQGQMTSSLTSEKLNVYLTLDGTFISAEIVP